MENPELGVLELPAGFGSLLLGHIKLSVKSIVESIVESIFESIVESIVECVSGIRNVLTRSLTLFKNTILFHLQQQLLISKLYYLILSYQQLFDTNKTMATQSTPTYNIDMRAQIVGKNNINPEILL